MPGFDARDWAKDFIEHATKNPSIPTDEGCMIGWFANAIMAGYDECKRQQKEEQDTIYAMTQSGIEESLTNTLGAPIMCANCQEVSTNRGQFLRDGRWVCCEKCRLELPSAFDIDEQGETVRENIERKR